MKAKLEENILEVTCETEEERIAFVEWLEENFHQRLGTMVE